MSIFTESQAKAILDKVIKLSKADECVASLEGSVAGNIRYALNSVSTSGIVSNCELAVQVAFGKKVGQASPEERPALLEGSKELAAKVKEAEAAQHEAQAALDAAHRAISNVVQEGAPAGGEDDYIVLEHVGEIPKFDFEPKDHLELGESLGLIDMERGAKVELLKGTSAE